jgi:hypothetical protein
MFIFIYFYDYLLFIFSDDVPSTSNARLKFSERQALYKAMANSTAIDNEDDNGGGEITVRTTRYIILF